MNVIAEIEKPHTLKVRPATEAEQDTIMGIYRIAQDFMTETGNPNQWRHEHPARELILEDIRRGICHVICDETGIHGVFALCRGEDPTYRKIEDGAWLGGRPYVTIHRIAGDRKVRGIFTCAMDYCKNITGNIRIDTHEDNKVMQHVLSKHGFSRCGIIYLLNGQPRIAYQWIGGTR